MKRFIPLTLALLASVPAWARPSVEIKNVELLSDTVVRVGDTINVALRTQLTDNNASETWLNVNCRANKQTLLLFSDFHTVNQTSGRIYAAGSISRYAPAIPFEADADSLLSTDPALDVCRRQIPEVKWAGLSAPDEKGDRLFIDLNNSQKQGNMLTFRLATDFAQRYHDDKYAAPYEMKVQDIRFNCRDTQGVSVRDFSLDGQGQVTNTRLPTDPATQVLSTENSRLAEKLCAVKDLQHYQGTGSLTVREKTLAEKQLTLPDFSRNDPEPLQHHPLSDEVQKQVTDTLTSPHQRPGFSHLSYTQRWSDDENSYSVYQIDRMADGTTLTLDALTMEGVTFYSQHLRLFNFVDLKSWDSLSPKPLISLALRNYVALPLAERKTFQWFVAWDNNKFTSTDCRTEDRWHDAAQLSPALSGRYLEVVCQDDRGDGKAMSSDYAWLEDLRVFIRIGYQESGIKKRAKLTNVVVTR